MILFKEAQTLHNHIQKLRLSGKTIGFVPTMGALHKGHLSLITHSRSRCDITICSIFVNPTQFNDPRDFEKYPVTIAEDIALLEQEHCDILFLPSVSEMYPNGPSTSFHYQLGSIETVLEGKHRPGHFQGVCQAVHRLLDIVDPEYLFTGQKDYQQWLVLRKLVHLINSQVTVVKVDTYREESGLAMSSRNLRLTDQQKEIGAGISKTLTHIKDNWGLRPARKLEDDATDYLLRNGFNKVDYVAIADAETLQPAQEDAAPGSNVAVIAAFLGDVRLIDNIVF